MKKKIICLLFLITSCSQNFGITQFNKQNVKYKTCLQDANHNIEKNININQDRIDMMQTDDTMVDLYNIENEVDEIKLFQERNKMVEDCMQSR